MSFQLKSAAFGDGSTIPAAYTADGEDYSPPLSWSNPPPDTVSLALICEDPDAPRGLWVHWVIFNLPATPTELPEHVPTDGTLANGALQGKNDFRKLGYGGPAPPPGRPHRYYFTLYALDTSLKLPAGASRDALLSAMRGHVLAEARWMGIYER